MAFKSNSYKVQYRTKKFKKLFNKIKYEINQSSKNYLLDIIGF